MPEEYRISQREPVIPGIFEYDIVYTPVVPLKHIRVNVVLNKPIEKIKLKTRYQILKECF